MDRRSPGSAAIGRAAEEHALERLQAAGLQLVARNFRCRLGEIDLVMRDGGTLVFVEVRRRAGARFGDASESVTVAKRRKLQAAAAVFVAWHPELGRLPMRFDLYALDGRGEGQTAGGKWLRGIIA